MGGGWEGARKSRKRRKSKVNVRRRGTTVDVRVPSFAIPSAFLRNPACQTEEKQDGGSVGGVLDFAPPRISCEYTSPEARLLTYSEWNSDFRGSELRKDSKRRPLGHGTRVTVETW